MHMASGATLGEAITKASASVRVCERRELRLRVLDVMQIAGCQRLVRGVKKLVRQHHTLYRKDSVLASM
jgi:hypothetical protein